MAIIITCNSSDFRKAFYNAGRGSQFSSNGLEKLFEHLEQLSDDSGEDLELDVVGICCDYAEYNDVQGFLEDYDIDVDTVDMDEDEILNEIRDYLESNTTVISCDDDCILFATF